MFVQFLLDGMVNISPGVEGLPQVHGLKTFKPWRLWERGEGGRLLDSLTTSEGHEGLGWRDQCWYQG